MEADTRAVIKEPDTAKGGRMERNEVLGTPSGARAGGHGQGQAAQGVRGMRDAGTARLPRTTDMLHSA